MQTVAEFNNIVKDLPKAAFTSRAVNALLMTNKGLTLHNVKHFRLVISAK